MQLLRVGRKKDETELDDGIEQRSARQDLAA